MIVSRKSTSVSETSNTAVVVVSERLDEPSSRGFIKKRHVYCAFILPQ